jgi:hypothetical protein
MMRMISEIAYMVMLIAGYRAIKVALGEDTITNLSEFMFGPYIRVFDTHFSSGLPDWAGAFIAIIGICILAMMLRNWIKTTRYISAFIIALVSFDLAYLYFDPAIASPIDVDWLLYAVIGLGWLFLSGALVERAFWLWLRSSLFGRA